MSGSPFTVTAIIGLHDGVTLHVIADSVKMAAAIAEGHLRPLGRPYVIVGIFAGHHRNMIAEAQT